VTFYDFLSLKNSVNVASKSNKQKNITRAESRVIGLPIRVDAAECCLTYPFFMFAVPLADLPTMWGDVVFYYKTIPYSQ
jgi:hypothetical protein